MNENEKTVDRGDDDEPTTEAFDEMAADQRKTTAERLGADHGGDGLGYFNENDGVSPRLATKLNYLMEGFGNLKILHDQLSSFGEQIEMISVVERVERLALSVKTCQHTAGDQHRRIKTNTNVGLAIVQTADDHRRLLDEHDAQIQINRAGIGNIAETGLASTLRLDALERSAAFTDRNVAATIDAAASETTAEGMDPQLDEWGILKSRLDAQNSRLDALERSAANTDRNMAATINATVEVINDAVVERLERLEGKQQQDDGANRENLSTAFNGLSKRLDALEPDATAPIDTTLNDTLNDHLAEIVERIDRIEQRSENQSRRLSNAINDGNEIRRSQKRNDDDLDARLKTVVTELTRVGGVVHGHVKMLADFGLANVNVSKVEFAKTEYMSGEEVGELRIIDDPPRQIYQATIEAKGFRLLVAGKAIAARHPDGTVTKLILDDIGFALMAKIVREELRAADPRFENRE